MKISSARLGEIEIDPAHILTLNEGIIGFPDYKRYIFLPFLEGTAFELFQAIDNPSLAFVTINPFLFCSDYEFQLGDEELQEIQVTSKEDLAIKVIVTIPVDPKQSTANLQGPILINESRLMAKQIILHEAQYGTKQRIFTEENGKNS